MSEILKETDVSGYQFVAFLPEDFEIKMSSDAGATFTVVEVP